MGGSECFGAGADEVDMGAFLKNEAGSQNGILDSLDTRHATRFHATAVHEKGIELDSTVGGKKTASTGVESWVILENHDGSLNSIESGASAGQDRVPGFKSACGHRLRARARRMPELPKHHREREGWDRAWNGMSRAYGSSSGRRC